VSVKARNNENQPTNLTVSTYSNKPVDIKKLDATAYGGLRGFLTKRQFVPGSYSCLVDQDSYGDNVIKRGYWWTKHCYQFYLLNQGSKPWNVSIKFPAIFNYTLGKPGRASPNEFKIQVAPGQNQFVYLKRVPTWARVTDFGGDPDINENMPFKFVVTSDIK